MTRSEYLKSKCLIEVLVSRESANRLKEALETNKALSNEFMKAFYGGDGFRTISTEFTLENSVNFAVLLHEQELKKENEHLRELIRSIDEQ